MSRRLDEEEWPWEKVDRFASTKFMLGIAGGYEDAAKDLNTMSGEAFAKRNHERARLLQEISDDLKKIAAKKRALYEEVDQEFKELYPK